MRAVGCVGGGGGDTPDDCIATRAIAGPPRPYHPDRMQSVQKRGWHRPPSLTKVRGRPLELIRGTPFFWQAKRSSTWPAVRSFLTTGTGGEEGRGGVTHSPGEPGFCAAHPHAYVCLLHLEGRPSGIAIAVCRHNDSRNSRGRGSFNVHIAKTSQLECLMYACLQFLPLLHPK